MASSRGVSDTELRILLVGKTGSGKSSTGNSIIGSDRFTESSSASSCTQRCQVEKVDKFDKRILIVDSPGLFDTSGSDKNITKEIRRYAVLSAPGPHVIIYVVSAQGRFTEEEIETTRKLRAMFGPGLSKYLIVLITKTESWKKRGKEMTTQEFMRSLPESAQNLLTSQVCQYRTIAFSNTLEGEASDEQVHALFEMVEEVKRQNHNSFYSDAHWKEAESALSKRVDKLMKDNPKLTYEEATSEIRRKIAEETRWCTIL